MFTINYINNDYIYNIKTLLNINSYEMFMGVDQDGTLQL